MKILSAVFFLLLSINQVKAQWIPLNNFPSDNNLYSVYFTDDEHGWISGSEGTLLKLNYELFRWEAQNIPVNSDLFGVGFFDNNTGVAVGSNGTIIRSQDGGLTWLSVAINLSGQINDLFILDSEAAYASAEGLILKSSDMGLTWNEMALPVANDIRSVFFVNENLGFAGTGYLSDLDSTLLLRTTDGGATWTSHHFEADPARNINAIYFVDSLTGYIGGGAGDQKGLPIFYKTGDGGNSWEKIDFQFEIHDIKFSTEGKGIISGGEQTYNKFLALYSDDQIENIIYHNEDYDIFAVCITPSGKGWAVGGGGEIIYSDSYNMDWKHIYSGSPYWNIPTAIDITPDNQQYLGFEWGNFRYPGGMIMKRMNETHMFRDLSFYIDMTDNDNIPHQINMLDSTTGYYVSTYGNIFNTTNGGFNWGLINFGFQLNMPAGIFFQDSQTGWTFSSGIYKTTNGGDTWELQYDPAGILLTDLMFTDGLNGYACGSDENLTGKIFKTTDGGLTWNTMTIPEVNHLTAISFTHPDTGIVVGWGNTKLITYDGGKNWNSESSGKPAVQNSYILKKRPTLRSDKRFIYTKNSGILRQTSVLSENNYLDVVFKKNIIFIASGSGEILISEDYGKSWKTDNIGSPVLEIDSDGIKNTLARTGENVYLYNFSNPVPVELVNFSARAENRQVILEWSTATETNNSGFDIERKSGDEWTKIAFVEGKGTTSELSLYTFTDELTQLTGNISYRLKQIDFSGIYEYSEEVTVKPVISSYTLEQNFPNPFNPSTKIRYQLPEREFVTITIIDALGREIANLENSMKEPGYYELVLNSADLNLSSGVYIYSMKAGKFHYSQKMLLLK